jgi:hypothetical protein
MGTGTTPRQMVTAALPPSQAGRELRPDMTGKNGRTGTTGRHRPYCILIIRRRRYRESSSRLIIRQVPCLFLVHFKIRALLAPGRLPRGTTSSGRCRLPAKLTAQAPAGPHHSRGMVRGGRARWGGMKA